MKEPTLSKINSRHNRRQKAKDTKFDEFKGIDDGNNQSLKQFGFRDIIRKSRER